MRRWSGPVLKLAITALILAAIAWQIDFGSAIEALSRISIVAAAIAVAVVLAQAFASAIRLKIVVGRFGHRFGVADSFRVSLESMFFSHAFVSFLGGDALRIWRVRRIGASLTDATSAVTLDRFIGIFVNHIFMLMSLPWLLVSVRDPSLRYAYVLLAIVGTVGCAAVLILGALRGQGGYLHELRMRIPVKSLAMLVVEAATVGRYVIRDYARLTGAWLASIAIVVTNMVVFAAILIGMGVDASLAVGCALLAPAVLEIAMLPISIAGLGLREGAAVVAFGALGVPHDQALGASLAFGLALLLVGLIGGVLWLVDRRRMAAAVPDVAQDTVGSPTVP